MAPKKSIEDLLVTAQVLTPDKSVADALATMNQANLDYCVVKDQEGRLLGVTSVEQLKSKGKQQKLEDIFEGGPPPISLTPALTLDKIEVGVAALFTSDPKLEGIIVDEESPRVLPRKKILEHALEIVSYRGVDRLEGSPLDVVIYECPIDHERKILEYFTGLAPVCSQGHPMEIVSG